MNITFTAKNGFCPYFLYKNIKYFIQDRKINNDWTYYLCSRDLQVEVTVFETHELALDHVQCIRNISCRYFDRRHKECLFSTTLKDYAISDKMLTVRNSFNVLTGDFNNYLDCLEFSKQYVSNIINNSKPIQERFFD